MALNPELLAYVPEDKRAEFAEKTKEFEAVNEDLILARVKASQSMTDKIATPVAEARHKNYLERDFPEVLKAEREKIRAELAKGKEETPEQKELREIKEKLAERDRKEAIEAKKAQLRQKASALKLDPLKAERYYAIDDAEKLLEEQAADAKAWQDKIADLEKKIKYGSNPPPGGDPGNGKTMARADFDKLAPAEKDKFLKSGGKPE
jgi:hypothetical protein